MIRLGVDGLRLDQCAGAAWLSAVAFAAAAVSTLALAGEPVMNERVQIGRSNSDMPAQSVVVRSVQIASVSTLQELISEALKNNPEIRAAAHEKEAAAQRISPAGALDDPMIEAGLISVPLQSLRLNREDMTMKMLGVSQRLPYPGKRGLRADVAAKDAESVGFGYQETVNRVIRDVRVAYYDIALIDRSIELLERNRRLIEQLLRIAEGRYTVGQGAQAEVLRAQTQLAKMSEELVRMHRERRSMEAELVRALGRGGEAGQIKAALPGVDSTALNFDALREAALRQRPQLLGLRTLIDKNQKALDLARKDYYPDFDLRFQYGQRDNMPDGTPRSDLVSFTVAINLPVWEKQKLDPKIAEAQAMREQALSMYQAQENELAAKLRQQIAIAEQSRESARLYETGILPQARLALESALSAYKVNRIDFQMLLDSQMSVFGYEINHAGVVTALGKALAEIDQLTGKPIANAR